MSAISHPSIDRASSHLSSTRVAVNHLSSPTHLSHLSIIQLSSHPSIHLTTCQSSVCLSIMPSICHLFTSPRVSHPSVYPSVMYLDTHRFSASIIPTPSVPLPPPPRFIARRFLSTLGRPSPSVCSWRSRPADGQCLSLGRRAPGSQQLLPQPFHLSRPPRDRPRPPRPGRRLSDSRVNFT